MKQEGSLNLLYMININHDSWTNAFKEKDFFKWIYSQKKSIDSLTQKMTQNPYEIIPTLFVAVPLEINLNLWISMS